MKQFIADIKNSLIFTKKCKKNLTLLILFGIIVSIISSIIPKITGTLINDMIDLKYQKVIINIVLIGTLEVLLMIFNILTTKNYLTFRQKFVSNIRKITFNHILNLQLNEYQTNEKGSVLISKFKEDTNRLTNHLNKLKDCSIYAFTNLNVLFIVFLINKIVGIAYIIFTIILLIIRYNGIKKSLYYKKKNLELIANNYNLLNQVVKGAKDIKVLKLKDAFQNKTNNYIDEVGTLEYKSISYQDYADKISKFLESLFQGIIILISVILIKNKMLTIDSFIIIFMYRSRIFNFSSKFSTFINVYSQYSISLNRILSVIGCSHESFGENQIKDCTGKIKLHNVSFSYENEMILKKIKLTIHENTLVSLVGESGVGKSTLFSLITKIINPSSGHIYIDDYDISQLSENSIRKNISLVTQQPFIFNLSIKENLSIIDDNFNHIKEVCKQVGLSEKIEQLENGYDTIIDGDATNLSGGEKQRLAIARALLSDTKIILLDEITNNLDNKSIKDIIKLLHSLKNKYTIIIITHNQNIMKNSDRIIVLDEGHIIGDGTHQELIENNTSYKKIYRGIK